ncbi:MAG: class I SAM-dependent methyltransferase [Pseudomonadota bacterium]
MNEWGSEIANGRRFEFGRNWNAFLSILDESRIREAENSLRKMLGLESMTGLTFLDVGCGSGLFSLAARRLGAIVHSFDFDPDSVACTRSLKQTFFRHDDHWRIDEGSALDTAYLAGLGKSDIVYSWGVLHHTGQMWAALENVKSLVADDGILFIAIYDDQGWKSRAWWKVKRIYNGGTAGKLLVITVFVPAFVVKGLLFDLLKLRSPFARYREKMQQRGMSMYYDWIDWLGGFPFEFAKDEEVVRFFSRDGFRLVKSNKLRKMNEFVFKAPAS